MNKKNIIIAVSCILLFLGIGSLINYKINERVKDLVKIQQEVSQKELVDNITRSLNQYASKKDIEQFIKDNNVNLNVIKKDLADLDAVISSINVVKINSSYVKKDNVPSTSTGQTNPIIDTNPSVEINDTYGYLKKQQNLKLNEIFEDKQVPIGEVGFSAWRENPWNFELKERKYNVTSVISSDENNRQFVYNKFSINIDGKNYDLKINSAITKQQLPGAKFSFWNPRLFLGINENIIGIDSIISLNLGFMSYGIFKNQPEFSFLQLGVGYGIFNKTLQLDFSPVMYNIGEHLPLINNLFVGPYIGCNTDGNITIGGGLRVGL